MATFSTYGNRVPPVTCVRLFGDRMQFNQAADGVERWRPHNISIATAHAVQGLCGFNCPQGQNKSH